MIGKKRLSSFPTQMPFVSASQRSLLTMWKIAFQTLLSSEYRSWTRQRFMTSGLYNYIYAFFIRMHAYTCQGSGKLYIIQTDWTRAYKGYIYIFQSQSLGQVQITMRVCRPVLRKFNLIPSPAARKSFSNCSFRLLVPKPTAPWKLKMKIPPFLKLVPSSPCRNNGTHRPMSLRPLSTCSHSWCDGKIPLYFSQKFTNIGLASWRLYPPRTWFRSFILNIVARKSEGLIQGNPSRGTEVSVVTGTG